MGEDTDSVYDIIIAGGGVAGILAASRLATMRPDLRLLLLEREGSLGGRLRATHAGPVPRYSYGLNAIGDTLYDALAAALAATSDAHGDSTTTAATASTLPSALLGTHRQAKVGVLAGGRIAEVAIQDWFTATGAKLLGGTPAARQWPEVEQIMRQGATADPRPLSASGIPMDAGDAVTDDDDEAAEPTAADAGGPGRAGAKAQPFGQHWKLPRKVPAAIALKHYANAIGIPDLWSAAPAALAMRARHHASRLHCGAWDEVLTALVQQPPCQKALHVATNDRIVDAKYEDQLWLVQAQHGTYRGKALLIAQPPWQASAWLGRSYWPASLLHVASKTKPVSAVILTEHIRQAPEHGSLPDVIVVPAEGVQIVCNSAQEVVLQATIDFEQSLQAPAVVKAVKALKRARRKLDQLYPGCISETNHIALLPVAWAQSPGQSDRRWLVKLDQPSLQNRHLAFCGDAYGSAYDGDRNLVHSVTTACAALS